MNRRLDSDFQSDTAQPVTLNYQLAPNIRRRYIKRNKEKDMASHKYKVNISVDQKQTHEVASAGGCGRTVSKQRGQPSTQPSGDRTPGGGGVFRRTGIRAPFPMPGASGEFHTQEASPGSTPKQSHKPIKTLLPRIPVPSNEQSTPLLTTVHKRNKTPAGSSALALSHLENVSLLCCVCP